MSVPPILGTTLFLGDSITVGLPAFVRVEGDKPTIAEVSRTVDWLLPKVQAFAKAGSLGPVQNVVMLIGTNDIGGSRSTEAIFADMEATWRVAKSQAARLFVQTIPPFKGWPAYASRFQALEQRRQDLNARIRASQLPDLVLRTDLLLADPQDVQKLASAYDSGDHLHPNKKAHGALLQSALGGEPASPGNVLPAGTPAGPASSPSTSTNAVPLLVLGCIVFGGGYLLTRKHGLLSPL